MCFFFKKNKSSTDELFYAVLRTCFMRRHGNYSSCLLCRWKRTIDATWNWQLCKQGFSQKAKNRIYADFSCSIFADRTLSCFPMSFCKYAKSYVRRDRFLFSKNSMVENPGINSYKNIVYSEYMWFIKNIFIFRINGNLLKRYFDFFERKK